MDKHTTDTWINLLNFVEKQTGKTIRHFPEVRQYCLNCQSTNVEQLGEIFFVCNDCEAEWKAYFCRSCGAYMDSRDPASQECKVCGNYHCDCGQDSRSECARLQTGMETDEEDVDNYAPDEYYADYYEGMAGYGETCDWCNSPHVTYHDEAFALCESCREQMMGE
ncbi:MAG: hypothetical protein Kow00108_19650 [Calditrichia bacterium]